MYVNYYFLALKFMGERSTHNGSTYYQQEYPLMDRRED